MGLVWKGSDLSAPPGIAADLRMFVVGVFAVSGADGGGTGFAFRDTADFEVPD